MADSVDIDLYADVEQDFPQEDFTFEAPIAVPKESLTLLLIGW